MNESKEIPVSPSPPLTPSTVRVAVTPPAKTSGMAIASLVLSILGFCTFGLCAIVGLILGIVSLKKINSSNGRLKGGGLAIAGISVSSVAVLLAVLQLLIFIPALGKARLTARSIQSTAQIRSLTVGIGGLMDDNNGVLPDAENWPEALAENYFGGPIDDLLACPFDDQGRRGYAMNQAISLMHVDDDIRNHSQTVLFFEAKYDGPVSGGPELLPDQPRFYKGYVIGFVDGHVEVIEQSRVSQLIWQP